MWQAIRMLASGLRRGVCRSWAAVRALGGADLLAALTALGQWGLLVGLLASTVLFAKAFGGPRDPIFLALTLGAAVLLVASALVLGSFRPLFRRLAARPAAFTRHLRRVRHRAWALVAIACLAPGLVLAGLDPAAAGASLRQGIPSSFDVAFVGTLFVVAAFWGGLFGLSRRLRVWLFGLGVVLGLAVSWGMVPAGAAAPSVGWGAEQQLWDFLFVAVLYLACAIVVLYKTRQIAPGPAPVPSPFPLPSPVPLGPSMPPGSSAPPPLPRHPATGRVRRQLEL